MWPMMVVMVMAVSRVNVRTETLAHTDSETHRPVRLCHMLQDFSIRHSSSFAPGTKELRECRRPILEEWQHVLPTMPQSTVETPYDTTVCRCMQATSPTSLWSVWEGRRPLDPLCRSASEWVHRLDSEVSRSLMVECVSH